MDAVTVRIACPVCGQQARLRSGEPGEWGERLGGHLRGTAPASVCEAGGLSSADAEAIARLRRAEPDLVLRAHP